jgi:arylsulfatase A-like enzyme
MLTGCDSQIIVDRALTFIKDAARRGQPFFASVWFHAPHDPVFAGPEFLELYHDQPAGAAHYYGVVTAMDRQVGCINQTLRELSIDQQTVLWFCSDNGPEGNGRPSLAPDARFQRFCGVTGGLRGRKRSLFNGGVGVPALVKWPGIVAAGVEFTTPCSTLDYLPTIAALVGYAMPDSRPLDGISLLPLFTGAMSKRPVPIPYRFLAKKKAMYDAPTLALMDNPFKFLTNLSADGAEDMLFDLDADVAETNNIVACYPDRAREMRQRLAEFMASCRRSHVGGDYSEPYGPINEFQEITGDWLPE